MIPLAMLLMGVLTARPDIVLITVDTLRTDHLGCYGYERPTSPAIDRLAAASLLFEDCLCEEPQTTPSMCSMFASRPPRSTGCIRNAVPLPAEIPTVTQRFHDAGYYTGAVVSNWNLKRELCRLERGFDVYDDGFGRPHLGLMQQERYADEVTALALAMLAKREPGRPGFFWFHYMDPHAPYRYHRDHNPWGRNMRDLAGRDEVRARYDCEIAFADHHIGCLLDALPKENLFVIFAADHGESLFEHGILGHSRDLYQPGLRIPLLVRGPGISPGHTSLPARGMDIGPTLLGLAGLTPSPGMIGVDLLHSPPSRDRLRVFETYGGGVREGADAHQVLLDRPPKSQGCVLDGWKLILNASTPELYFLATDPLETRDLAGKEPQCVNHLRTLIVHWTQETPPGAALAAPLTKDDERALDAAGYL